MRPTISHAHRDGPTISHAHRDGPTISLAHTVALSPAAIAYADAHRHCYNYSGSDLHAFWYAIANAYGDGLARRNDRHDAV